MLAIAINIKGKFKKNSLIYLSVKFIRFYGLYLLFHTL